MKKIVILIFLTFSSCGDVFSNKEYVENIPQKIGGNLICNVHYFDDQHSYHFHIDYVYKDKLGKKHKIGDGNFSGQEWPKNEQILNWENHLVLITSDSYNSDKIIISDLNADNWKEFIISPETIEKDKLWKSKNIASSPDNGDSVSRITTITKDGFEVNYIYAKKNRSFSFQTGEKLIVYKINLNNNELEMIKVLPTHNTR